MKAREVFSDALIIYLRRIWIYLLFSFVITLALFTQIALLIRAEFSALHLVAVWALALTDVLFSVYLIAYTLKIHPHKERQTLLFSVICAGVICLSGVVFRLLFFSPIQRWIVYIIMGCVLWMIGSVIVLYACQMLTKSDTSFLSIIGRNKAMCAKCFLYTLGVFVLFTFVALAGAQPSKIATAQPFPEVIREREKVLSCIFVFLFIPLYILMFAELYKAITSRQIGIGT